MDAHRSVVASVYHFAHKRLIWLLLSSYLIAACFPAVGLWLKSVSFGTFNLWGEHVRISLPMLMLAFLLMNAGMGVETSQMNDLRKRLFVLAAGSTANLLVPIAFIFAVTQIMLVWHNPDEVQNILVGLALIASMPIAGSSTAWAQNANGNLALSLGLVLATTLLSPVTTPIALHAVGLMTTGDYAEDLHELAMGGTGAFLTLCVIVPSLLGAAMRGALSACRRAAIGPHLKFVNSLILLLLNYSNASITLPQAIANPDLDFLAVILVITLSLCATTFAAGWAVAVWTRVDAAQRTSLMFGLGMNNNGTGLVLASMALADHPNVMLPIIFYNLVQHLVAGVVNHWFCRAPRESHS